MIRRYDLGENHVLEAHEIIGTSSGPTIAVLGGVHGDELEGVTAARMLLNSLDPAQLHGCVRVVPVANPSAFASQTRLSPIDGLNLARRFPGSANGSVTDRIADLLTTKVIAGADLLIDLHSAGANYEMPVFAGFVDEGATAAESEAAARAFAAPVLWVHNRSNPGRSITAAAELGVPSFYVEGSGGGGLRGDDLDVYTGGLRRVMVAFGMVEPTSHDDGTTGRAALLLRGDDGDVDASLTTPADGYCVTRVRPGELVAEGRCLAEIVGSDGAVVHSVRSPRTATVMMLRRRAAVAAGDAIAMLGPVPAQPPVAVSAVSAAPAESNRP